MIYNSDIRVNSDKRIVVFSDIHADFHALLIALRDCAKVIRKKNIIDDLEYQLNLNLNNTTEYIDDLGYEWVSDCDTYVVLVGDIIDGSRGYDKNFIAKKINGIETTIHDYPQIELKILKYQITDCIEILQEQTDILNSLKKPKTKLLFREVLLVS